MKTRQQIVREIHTRACAAVRRFKACEFELIAVLEDVDRAHVFTAMGHSSLYNYATAGLGLSEEVAYTYINVARKTREVPALKSAIQSGAVTVSKARRICSVLRPENQKHWLGLAAKCTKRELEKLVASEDPRAAVADKAKYVSRDRVQLQVGVSEKLMIDIRRAQDVLSQKKRRAASLEDTLAAAVALFLRNEDPLERAKRQLVKGRLTEAPAATTPVMNANSQMEDPTAQLCPGTVDSPPKPTQKRKRLPAATKHKVNLLHQSQCAFVDAEGKRCEQRRFLEYHHKVPLAEGGSDEVSNLELLCSGHHRVRHLELGLPPPQPADPDDNA